MRDTLLIIIFLITSLFVIGQEDTTQAFRAAERYTYQYFERLIPRMPMQLHASSTEPVFYIDTDEDVLARIEFKDKEILLKKNRYRDSGFHTCGVKLFQTSQGMAVIYSSGLTLFDKEHKELATTIMMDAGFHDWFEEVESGYLAGLYEGIYSFNKRSGKKLLVYEWPAKFSDKSYLIPGGILAKLNSDNGWIFLDKTLQPKSHPLVTWLNANYEMYQLFSLFEVSRSTNLILTWGNVKNLPPRLYAIRWNDERAWVVPMFEGIKDMEEPNDIVLSPDGKSFIADDVERGLVRGDMLFQDSSVLTSLYVLEPSDSRYRSYKWSCDSKMIMVMVEDPSFRKVRLKLWVKQD